MMILARSHVRWQIQKTPGIMLWSFLNEYRICLAGPFDMDAAPEFDDVAVMPHDHGPADQDAGRYCGPADLGYSAPTRYSRGSGS